MEATRSGSSRCLAARGKAAGEAATPPRALGRVAHWAGRLLARAVLIGRGTARWSSGARGASIHAVTRPMRACSDKRREPAATTSARCSLTAASSGEVQAYFVVSAKSQSPEDLPAQLGHSQSLPALVHYTSARGLGLPATSRRQASARSPPSAPSGAAEVRRTSRAANCSSDDAPRCHARPTCCRRHPPPLTPPVPFLRSSCPPTRPSRSKLWPWRRATARPRPLQPQ